MSDEGPRVVSVSVGPARTVPRSEHAVRTGIFKAPTPSRVHVHRLGLEGDEQADLEAHGGPLKAVYAYPSEHYAFWRPQLPDVDLPWGAFGENLTTTGLSEDTVHVGDRYRIGSAVLAATKPRFPCYKLGIRLGHEDIVDRFLASGRTGFYLRVVEEGDLAAGDAIECLSTDPEGARISDLVGARRQPERR